MNRSLVDRTQKEIRFIASTGNEARLRVVTGPDGRLRLVLDRGPGDHDEEDAILSRQPPLEGLTQDRTLAMKA